MYYGNIKYRDIANGQGVRTSLFVSGCRVNCPGCFNKETWDFNYGQAFTKEVEDQIIQSLEPPFIAGLSVLGGEPMEAENQKDLVGFFEKVKKAYPSKTMWVYTGYYFHKDLQEGQRKYTPYTKRIMELIDVLVDGPFIEAEKDIRLNFRGSRNQHIIYFKS